MTKQCTSPSFSSNLSVTQLRSATIHIDINSVKFLVDPMLLPLGGFPGFALTTRSHLQNPLVHLPFPIDEIVDVDAVIVTHLHTDHWDDGAVEHIPKDKVIFAQNEADAAHIRGQGFSDVRVMTDNFEFKGVTLSKTDGTHGTPDVMEKYSEFLGIVSGVVMQSPGSKSVYLAGDTVFNHQVKEVLEKFKPEVVIVNAGYAQLEDRPHGSLIMGTEDVKALHEFVPEAQILATHMEAINHCMLTRAELRKFATENNFRHVLSVPGDGETIRF